MIIYCVGCLLLTASQAVTKTSDDAWVRVMDKHGIMAYARKIEGSGIFEFRAVMVVDARPEVVSEMLRDTPAISEWLPYCKESSLLEMKNRNNFTIYLGLNLPWPVKNRDLVMQATTRYDLDYGRAVTDLYNTTMDSCPPKDSHIRLPEMTGQYVFEFVTRERTGIIHTYRADLGGSIPEWMANIASKHTIYDEFISIKEMLKKEKYIQLGKTSKEREITERLLGDKRQVKKVMIARLREFIGDSDFMNLLGENQNIDDVLKADNGKISETMLYGWGSDKSKKKAIRVVLEIYLAELTRDETLIKTILNDNSLANTILRGPEPGHETSRQIINEYLKKKSDRTGQ